MSSISSFFFFLVVADVLFTDRLTSSPPICSCHVQMMFRPKLPYPGYTLPCFGFRRPARLSRVSSSQLRRLQARLLLTFSFPSHSLAPFPGVVYILHCWCYTVRHFSPAGVIVEHFILLRYTVGTFISRTWSFFSVWQRSSVVPAVARS